MASSNTQSVDAVEFQASKALDSYLNSQGNDQKAISSFIKPISDIYIEAFIVPEPRLEQLVEILWDVLLQKVQATPYESPSQDHLVTFLSAIKSTPPPTRPAPKIWGSELWYDLPTFGAAMRSRWNAGPRKNGLSEPK